MTSKQCPEITALLYLEAHPIVVKIWKYETSCTDSQVILVGYGQRQDSG